MTSFWFFFAKCFRQELSKMDVCDIGLKISTAILGRCDCVPLRFQGLNVHLFVVSSSYFFGLQVSPCVPAGGRLSRAAHQARRSNLKQTKI